MQIERDIDLRSITTFRLPARTAALVHYCGVEELKQALADEALPRPFKQIGGGSNLVFASDFPGTLLLSTDRSINISDPDSQGYVTLTAAAGCVMDQLCRLTAEIGLWGLENLSGIPGCAGASAVQNVGAYGVEASDLITSVQAYDIATGSEVTFLPEELDYGYRYSRFKSEEWRNRYIILSVNYHLSLNPAPRLEYGHLAEEADKLLPGGTPLTPIIVRDAVISLRDSKLPDPETIGSVGSFFKNPVVTRDQFDNLLALHGEIPHYDVADGNVKVPAAWLIDRCGLKGASVGGASVWRKQPLVIVNTAGNATPADVISLSNMIIERVFTTFGITLKPEAEIL